MNSTDVFVAIGALVTVAVAYLVGWAMVDLTGWIKLSQWQAHPDHIGGVRFFAGACVLGLGGIVVQLMADR